MTDLSIRQVETEAEIQTVRNLCWAYRDHLLRLSPEERAWIESVYPDDIYTDLMTRIATVHAPPKGTLLLADVAGLPVGCGMSYQIQPDVVEIKRLYVTDAARGTGVGQALVKELLVRIRAAGYATVMLDTLHSLTEAQELYLALGFTERGPFHDVPKSAEGILRFYELAL